jgi:predicted methyltransferase
MGPVLTLEVVEHLQAAARSRIATTQCSLDLGRSLSTVAVTSAGFGWRGEMFPFPERCRPRTIYLWIERGFQPAARFATSLVKLVPTDWGPPTFEIDGIKMLPTARVSPYLDARSKVRFIAPREKRVLDTCGGLGYFAACCLEEGARHVTSYERNVDVLWLRAHNPWSPGADDRLTLIHADVSAAIAQLPSASFDAILHDPPRFGIAGELYSQHFYRELARVLKRRGLLFHYTGTPNRARGRDLAAEVSERLRRAGFTPRLEGDGLISVLD